MPTPSDLVTTAFADARFYASDATTKLATFLGSMGSAIQNAPLVNITFLPIEDPGSSTVSPYVAPTDYTSTLLDALSASITTHLGGGTGLSSAVETSIWDRARDRELATAQAAIDTITSDAESLGFVLPVGVLNDGIRRETRAYYDKSSALSRDIAIKQAELEQSNVQKAIEQGVQFEGAKADIVAKRSQAALDAFRVEVMRFDAEVRQDVAHWEAVNRLNEAIANYTLNGARVNSELLRANLSALLEVGKTGAQVYAQLTAAAYGLIHASAGVSASASDSVSYAYSNDTDSAPPSVTAI